MNGKQIGWYNLTEPKEFRNTYECAAWYEDVLVQPGKYPCVVSKYVERDRKEGKEVEGYINAAYVALPGIITSDEFGARFYGVPVGTYDNKKNAGKESSHTMMTYLYSMAHDILTNPDTPWELLPEYEAKPIDFIFDDEPCRTYGIFAR